MHPPSATNCARPWWLTCAIRPSVRRGFGQAVVMVTHDPVAPAHSRRDSRWPGGGVRQASAAAAESLPSSAPMLGRFGYGHIT